MAADYPTDDEYRALSKAAVATIEGYMKEDFPSVLTSTLNEKEFNVFQRNTDLGDVGTPIFKIVSHFKTAPQVLFDALLVYPRRIAWDEQVHADTRVIHVIDDHHDMPYTATNSAFGGTISSRDFVDVRYRNIADDGTYWSVSIASRHPSVPDSIKGFTRGTNGACANVLEPYVEDGVQYTKFTYIIQSNLAGWLPTMAVNQGIVSTAKGNMEKLQAYCDRIKDETFTIGFSNR